MVHTLDFLDVDCLISNLKATGKTTIMLQAALAAAKDRVGVAIFEKEMDEHRARWLHERSENDWFEIKDPGIEIPGMGQRFLGGLANLGGKR